MPAPRTAIDDMPLAARLLAGIGYPLRGGALACAAARIGPRDLAWYLANGFVQRWPRHADALALLAAPH